LEKLLEELALLCLGVSFVRNAISKACVVFTKLKYFLDCSHKEVKQK